MKRGTRRATKRAATGIAEALRTETIGGALLLAGAVLALALANSPWGDSYRHLLDTTVGPERFDLHLDLREWASDGLLAIFFVVAGIELKQEFLAGELRDPRRALLPVVAAVSGVVVPALIYLAVTAGEPGAARGWAVPTATDIAFALAVLALIGRHLPGSVRSFLLTLAVVDDLIAITIIAFFYTDELDVVPLVGALLVVAIFGWTARRDLRLRGPLLVLLGLVAWALVHASGVHATVAGVLLAFALPVGRDETEQLGDRIEHWLRPLSAGVAVPVFAFCSAGVALTGNLTGALSDPVALGIVAALVLGKPIGILASTLVLTRLTGTDPGMTRSDLFGTGLLAGVGFTVSLLIGELAFGTGSARGDHVRLAVLTASLLASLLASVVLVRRNSVYRRRLASSA